MSLRSDHSEEPGIAGGAAARLPIVHCHPDFFALYPYPGSTGIGVRHGNSTACAKCREIRAF